MGSIEILKRDLEIQKKKLEDLKAWESLTILIESQTAIVDKLEKQLEAMEDNTDNTFPCTNSEIKVAQRLKESVSLI